MSGICANFYSSHFGQITAKERLLTADCLNEYTKINAVVNLCKIHTIKQLWNS